MLPYSYKFPPDPMTCSDCGVSVSPHWLSNSHWVFNLDYNGRCFHCSMRARRLRAQEKERKRREKYHGVGGRRYF